MRLYLPATLPLLAQWHAAGTTGASPAAFAVTPALREWYAEGDDEELEWAATAMAGREALRLLDSDAEAVRRRVVIAADVPDADVVWVDGVNGDEGVERGSVRVGGVVRVPAWAAVLVDEESAVPVIAAAAGAVALADNGDEDAAFEVSEADDAELLWFAVDELGDLL